MPETLQREGAKTKRKRNEHVKENVLYKAGKTTHVPGKPIGNYIL